MYAVRIYDLDTKERLANELIPAYTDAYDRALEIRWEYGTDCEVRIIGPDFGTYYRERCLVEPTDEDDWSEEA